jgi:ferritin-like protein
MEMEGEVVKHYNELVKKSKDKDFVTFEIANDILEETVRHEQDMEDILTKLEV